MNWLPLIIPIILAVVLFWKFSKQTTWWEPLIPLGVTVLIIVFFQYIGVKSLTNDTEYWGNYVTEIRYYEEWNEYIHQTCTSTCCCDSKGENCQTITYDCSYVQTHPPYWDVVLNDGTIEEINQSEYNRLVNKFGQSPSFVELNHPYYTQDGDMYHSFYDNSYNRLETWFSEHSYENRLKASTSIFNFPDVSKADKEKYQLYDYPHVKDNYVRTILSTIYPVKESEHKLFDYINAKLGKDKQIRLWVLIFIDKPIEAAFLQENLWKRGNNNELTVCIGINKDLSIKWCKPFSWGKNKLCEVSLASYINGMKKLDLIKLGNFAFDDINKNWQRTSRKEYEYLTIEPPTWSIVLTWIISIIACIITGSWIVKNNFEN